MILLDIGIKINNKNNIYKVFKTLEDEDNLRTILYLKILKVIN